MDHNEEFEAFGAGVENHQDARFAVSAADVGVPFRLLRKRRAAAIPWAEFFERLLTLGLALLEAWLDSIIAGKRTSEELMAAKAGDRP